VPGLDDSKRGRGARLTVGVVTLGEDPNETAVGVLVGVVLALLGEPPVHFSFIRLRYSNKDT
jgi:hypothetical protein